MTTYTIDAKPEDRPVNLTLEFREYHGGMRLPTLCANGIGILHLTAEGAIQLNSFANAHFLEGSGLECEHMTRKHYYGYEVKQVYRS